MVTLFRAPARRRLSLFIAALAVGASLGVACQKVPLLAPSGSTITLTALSSVLPLNGSTDIIAQVIEPSGTPPHSGTHVTFTANLGTVQPSEAQTDINGRATATFKAGTASGTATITATSGGVSASGNNAIKIVIGTAAASAIFASASPNTLPANGGVSTLSALVRDANGNPLVGVPVTFSTTAGTLGSTLVVSDVNGIAQTTLTTSRTATITATAGSVMAPPTSGTGSPAITTVTNQVTVNVNAGPSISFGNPTPANPVVGQLVAFPITIAAPGTTGSPLRALSVDFGDGRRQDMSPGSSTSVTAQHAYSSPGTYTVTAVATDTNGDSGSAQTAVSIGRSPLPTVGLKVDTAPPLHQSTPIQFTVTAGVATGAPANTSLQDVTIDFGDGTSMSLGNASTSIVQHVYPQQKQYTVTATVTDTNGAVARTSTTIIIGP